MTWMRRSGSNANWASANSWHRFWPDEGSPTPLGVPPTPASSADQDGGATPQEDAATDDAPRPYAPAPDLAENDGVVAKQPDPGAPRRAKQRNRRHGRRR